MPEELNDLHPDDKKFFGLTDPEPQPQDTKAADMGSKIARWWGISIVVIVVSAVTLMIAMLAVKWLLWMYGMLFG